MPDDARVQDWLRDPARLAASPPAPSQADDLLNDSLHRDQAGDSEGSIEALRPWPPPRRAPRVPGRASAQTAGGCP
ncbi:MAG TPA: hypothetical protein VFY71_18465 [Planctomycetota bacterium]|nr:hypothetical protein [Planctomycetota bacterium]